VKRSAMIRRSVLAGQRPGDPRGRQDKSVIGHPDRIRSTHFFAVAAEHWNRSAARRNDQPLSKTRTAKRRRPSGVRGALA
jgi:hypothetical protein